MMKELGADCFYLFVQGLLTSGLYLNLHQYMQASGPAFWNFFNTKLSSTNTVQNLNRQVSEGHPRNAAEM